MKKPRLLVLTSTFPRWPNDHEPPFVYELARRLTDRFDVTVLAPHAPGAARREVMDGVQVVRFRYAPERLEKLAYDGGIPTKLRQLPRLRLLVPIFLIAQLLAAWRLMHHLRPDAIHAHWLLPQGLVAVLARGLAGIPARLLATSHGADIHALRFSIARWLKRLTLQHADAVTVVSHALEREASELTQEPEKLHVVPMGVDLQQRFLPARRNVGRPTLLFTGRLVEKKGVSTLLESLTLVLPEVSDCRLLIAGSGPQQSTLKASAQRLGIAGAVEFLGSYRNEDLPKLLQQSDVAVYPFRCAAGGDQEGLGLVMLEAMGCGLPVVAGNVPAVHDVIEHERTGLLVPPDDPPALANALLRLFNDPELAMRLANAGRTHALAKFDWPVIAERYADLLSQPTNDS